MDAGGFSSMPLASQLANLTAQQGDLPETGGDKVQTAKQFEALLATMLVKEMRQSLDDGFFGKGPGADTFGGWLDKSIGDSLAGNWQLDLAGMVKTNIETKQARLDGAFEAMAEETQ